jgi:hypothetical protein
VIYTFRPLGAWLEAVTDPRASSARFRARWDDTINLLSRELEQLDARNVVIQVDVEEAELRRDGMLRHYAKVGFPGVRVAFDSRHGPLLYATDAYEQQWSGTLPGWQANVRAIALGLEALRAVDRYGITRRAEQYQGWKAIGSGPATPMPSQMTADGAARLIGEMAGWASAPDPADPAVWRLAYKHAARLLHPDAGGSNGDFQRLQEAKRVLDEHAGVA